MQMSTWTTEMRLAACLCGIVVMTALPLAVEANADAECKGYEDRLVLVREDLCTDSSLAQVLKIVDTAADSGFTGIVLDSGMHGEGFDFHRFLPDRVARAKKVREKCAVRNMEICPVIWSVGRAHALVDYDPSLAEGLPIKSVPYVARAGKAVFDPAPDSVVGDCGFGETNKTIRSNPATGKITNSDRSIERFLKLKPNRLYRCTAKAKVKGVRGDGNRTLYVGYDLHVESVRPSTRPDVKTPNRAERETAIMLKKDSDWMDVCLDFVTVETGETYVIFMMDYASQQGTIWVKDVKLRELGLQKLVVRSGAPVVVRDARTGRVYRSGIDYVEPRCWISDHAKVPYDNPSDPDVELALPEGSAIKEGTKLLVDAYVMARRSNEQVGACMSNPAIYDYFEQSANAAVKVFGPCKRWFLQMDEIRAGNTCLDCERRHTDMGHIYADCLRRQLEILRKTVPDAEVMFWPDMVDPAFSAAEWRKGHDYFLCNGDFWDSRDLVPKALVPCPWYGLAAAKASMTRYAQEGVRTLYVTYYDVDSLDCDRGRGSFEMMNTIPGCRGFIYATFAKKYKLLKEFGEMAEKLSKPLPMHVEKLQLKKRRWWDFLWERLKGIR